MNKKERNELYENARKELDERNPQKAIEIYQLIRNQYPVEWEAFFFTICLKIYVCPDNELLDVATTLYQSEKDVFNLIDTYVKDHDKHIDAIVSVGSHLEVAALDLSAASFDIFEKSSKDDHETNDLINLNIVACNILKTYINSIMKRYSGDFKMEIWEKAMYIPESLMELYSKIIPFLNGDEKATFEAELDEWIELGKKYNLKCPDIINYSDKEKGKRGCYIATAVYGSYDCPQVWTLRRFRDYELSLTWYGRLFVKLYYAISPYIISWLGDKKWFNRLGKSWLDKLVIELKAKGVEDTPYQDRE